MHTMLQNKFKIIRFNETSPQENLFLGSDVVKMTDHMQ